jgi:hypothetical protein
MDDKNRNYYLFLVVHLVAKIFRRREVGIRLWSGALLFLLDLVLVVLLFCLIWVGWTPCCPLAPPSWQPCSSSWSASGDLLSDHGHWLLELRSLWWCLRVVCGVLETRWREKCCLWCVRLPMWCLSTTSAQYALDLLTLWSKPRLCMFILETLLFLSLPLVFLAVPK